MPIKKTILIFLFGTLIMAVLLRFQGKSLYTTHAPMGIVSMELANTLQKTKTVMADWTVGLSQIFYQNILLDFVFIFFYGGLFFLLSRYFATQFASLKNSGILFSWLALAAAILDVLENSLMLVSFSGHTHSVVSFLTFLFAGMKFLLIALVILYLLLVWFYSKFYLKKNNPINKTKWQ